MDQRQLAIFTLVFILPRLHIRERYPLTDMENADSTGPSAGPQYMAPDQATRAYGMYITENYSYWSALG
jgi:hypothetical protein